MSDSSFGSYGERGVMDITSALRDMFDFDSMPSQRFKPLREPGDFVRMVLLPETAAVLISEDLDISPAEARSVMKRSWAFGLALHPLDGEDK